MRTIFVRAALYAALALCAVSISSAGELDRQEAPEVRLRACSFRVHPPIPEARLYFEGIPIKGSGRERTFRSPAREEGKRYAHTVVAAWTENCCEVTHEMRVTFWAGDDMVVDFRR
jgi:uncharacterized protein (TIGR03000 family)